MTITGEDALSLKENNTQYVHHPTPTINAPECQKYTLEASLVTNTKDSHENLYSVETTSCGEKESKHNDASCPKMCSDDERVNHQPFLFSPLAFSMEDSREFPGYQELTPTKRLNKRPYQKGREVFKKYVEERGGCHTVMRILIANNGNAAVKAIRSLREWTLHEFDTDSFFEIVVMATQDDIQANAEYVSEGDFLAEVPGGPSENNYSNIPLIVQIVEEYECDAVWPGWGHASENPKFPLALEASLLSPLWIGPSATCMQLIGDKVSATLLAQSMDIPCIPWSGSGVLCDIQDAVRSGSIPQNCLTRCTVSHLEEVMNACRQIGYPVVIKASAGGGGRGIRKIFSDAEVESAYYHVVSEVKDSCLFVMKLLTHCRHLEVQIAADRFGQVASLGTRDCTVQRRCQKIIEESPVTVASKDIIQQMENYAIRLLSAVHYLSVATCEFLYDVSSKKLYFLEVNPRLQVEHVVTEVVYQINLPAIQLQTALGIPLDRVSDIFLEKDKESVRAGRHCLAARITAENAEENFTPTCGEVVELHLRSSMNAWGYFFLGVTGQVHRFADSQIGHVFAVGRNRDEARRHLILALKRLTVRGEIHTNVEALLKILDLRDFIENNIDTTWVEESVYSVADSSLVAEPAPKCQAEGKIKAITPADILAISLAASCEAFITFKRSEADFLAKIHQGQLPPPISGIHSVEYVYKDVRFKLSCFHTGPCQVSVTLNDSSTEMVLRPVTLPFPPAGSSGRACPGPQDELTSSACFLILGGPDRRSRRVFYKINSTETSITLHGSTFTFVKDNDPTQVRAPVSGRLSKWLVPSGTLVTSGTTYVDIEIMKMYMQLQVSNDGRLSHALSEGAVFKAGDLLATLELNKGVPLRQCVEYTGLRPYAAFQQSVTSCYSLGCMDEELPQVHRIRLEQPKLHRKFLRSQDCLRCVLNGYQCTTSKLQDVLNTCVDGFFDPIFPMYEVLDTFSRLGMTLPAELRALLNTTQVQTWNDQRSAVDLTSSDSGNTMRCQFFSDEEKMDTAIIPYVRRCLNLEKLKSLFIWLKSYLMEWTTTHTLETHHGQSNVNAVVEPLHNVMERFKHGLLTTAAETINDFFIQYLDVEEVFHQCTNESASKVLLRKRTELEAERLAVLARSHEALHQKNNVVIHLLGVLLQYYSYFVDARHSFNEALQRLSRLTKPQYAAVSLRAGQLLLMRHQQPFVERTMALTKSFAEFFETQMATSRTPNSQLMASMTPLCSTNTNALPARCCWYHSSLPVGLLPCYPTKTNHPNASQGYSNHSARCGSLHSHLLSYHGPYGAQLHHGNCCGGVTHSTHSSASHSMCPYLKGALGSVSGPVQAEPAKPFSFQGLTGLESSDLEECHTMLIHRFIDDWKNVADDSLIALLAHPKPEFCKLALEIYVRRHFSPCGLHNFEMSFAGEFWWRRATVLCQPQMSKCAKSLIRMEGFNDLLKDTTDLSVGKNFTAAPYHRTASQCDADLALPLQSQKSEDKSYDLAKCGECKRDLLDTEQKEQAIINTAGLQTVNRLLAVWVCSALMSYDFLTQCCDRLIETKIGSQHKPEPLDQVKATREDANTSQGADHTLVDGLRPNMATGDVQNPVSLFTNHNRCSEAKTLHSPAECVSHLYSAEERSNLKGSHLEDSGATLMSSGLNSNTRLGHMLNAFSDTCLTESTAGQVQMFVAMAFKNFESFRSDFEDCLKEYSELQAFMPPPPPAIDGKVLVIFISEMSGDRKACSSPVASSKSHFCLNYSSLLQADIQSRSVQIAALGFHLLQVCFTCERQTMSFFSEDSYPKRSLVEDMDITSHVLPYDIHFAEHPDAALVKDAWCMSSLCSATGLESPWHQQTFYGDEPFEYFDLVFSCTPRCLYFRNISALPLLSAPDDLKNETFNLERSGTDEAMFVEEALLRNVCCSQFHLLELKRLVNFFVQVEPVRVPHIHLFLASPKPSTGSLACCTLAKKPNESMFRFFVRILLHHQLKEPEDDDWDDVERHFVAGLNALELTLKNKFPQGQRLSPSHHIFMYVKVHKPSMPFAATALLNSQRLQHLSPCMAESVVFSLAQRYESRLNENGVGTLEVRFVQEGFASSANVVPLRIVVTNPTRQLLQVKKYVEITDPTTGEVIFSALDASDSLAMSARHPCAASKNAESRENPITTPPKAFFPSLWNSMSVGGMNSNTWKSELVYDGLPVCSPHPLFNPLEENRALAASLSTIYIYDFLGLFEEAVKKEWKSCPKYFIPGFSSSSLLNSADCLAEGYASPTCPLREDTRQSVPMALIPDKVLESVELVLNENGEIHETVREPGLNDCGMVAWLVLLRTPEFPRGRRMILVGNDVTFQMGTFGLREDLLFQRVSEMARKEGIPRVYIAVNSGARMGLATEVQKAFQVEWVETSNPQKGFKYLYLNEADYERLRCTDSIIAEPIIHPVTNQCLYRLTSVIGQVGLGVENLCGSGAIAGETSRAYDSNVSLTFVTGRTVGIGAYLSRLGHRVIQKATSAPILLTGYQVINRLIQRDVYTSNDELGGVDVMAKNGVTHIVVANDTQGCEEIIRWLSYVPEHTEGALPLMVDPTDPITRPVLYRVSSLTEDPRLMLTGSVDAKGRWLGGIFDRGTFREVLSDWAKSVIVGRARLGGIPVGVIAVETRVTEVTVPADPAVLESVETKLLRPGQMWFPDSAYKTAEAISNFNREEIPLIIFANWRGFSGGQRDMFHEVLKFGSFIVDALVEFKQPCIVYIPPKAELRGGAWVVVDSRINPFHMDMFADPDSRGGVLEPTGTVEIKFRTTGLAALADRLDPVLKQVILQDQQLANENIALDDPRRSALKESRDKRLQELLPIYKQIAVHFADLHDTPERMKKKKAIDEIVPWEKSRIYFYWRLRRQLIFFNLRLEVQKANPTLSLSLAEEVIYRWAKESGQVLQNSHIQNEAASCELNVKFVHWACHALSDITRRLVALRNEYQQSLLVTFMQKSPKLFKDTLHKMNSTASMRSSID